MNINSELSIIIIAIRMKSNSQLLRRVSSILGFQKSKDNAKKDKKKLSSAEKKY